VTEVDGPPLLAGRYELREPIGAGGMADVRRGVDVRLGRDVAVKVLRPDLARDPAFQARFRREAQAAASLSAPTIVSVFDTGEDVHGVPFIVMEFVAGRTLRDVLLDEGACCRSAHSRSAPTSVPRSTSRTARAWCTATSSPATSC